MADKLKLESINALPGPLLARFVGGDIWPVADIDVETGLMRIDVCGLLEVKQFADVTQITDGDHEKHDADSFWHN